MLAKPKKVRRVTVRVPVELAKDVDEALEDMAGDWSTLVGSLLDQFIQRRRQTREAWLAPGRRIWTGRARAPTLKVLEGGKRARR